MGGVGSYFWQDLWAAKKVFQNPADIHYDIASRVDGFIAHLLSFGQSVRAIDIRPADAVIPGYEFKQADATNMDSFEDGTIKSLSALCSLEHFGLGRYGDEIDPEACFKCMHAIQNKMATGGNLYISVPIGMEHLVFNAHRVYYAQTIVDEFSQMTLMEFSCYVDGNVESNIDLHKYDNSSTEGALKIGLFHFKKK